MVYKTGDFDAMGLRIKVRDGAVVTVVGDVVGGDKSVFTKLEAAVRGRCTRGKCRVVHNKIAILRSSIWFRIWGGSGKAICSKKGGSTNV